MDIKKLLKYLHDADIILYIYNIYTINVSNV
jgi:hypothetical protein